MHEKKGYATIQEFAESEAFTFFDDNIFSFLQNDLDFGNYYSKISMKS